MKPLPTFLAGLILATIVLSETPSQAQVVVRRPMVIPASAVYNMPSPYGLRPHYYVGPGYYPWRWTWGGTTAAESYMRGAAYLTHARGQYNLLTSQAAINLEHARSLDLDNFRKNAETYFSVREINKAAREKERGPRPTQEKLARLAKVAAPRRLDATQLNARSGQIAWPAALQGEEYAEYRAQIERLLSEQAAGGRIAGAGRQQMGQATDAMLAMLKSEIREISPMEYSGAKRFLESLSLQALRSNS